ncbi:hypothetical protein HDU87_004037 [Geranomyces variabilis]|uniref:Polymerase beta nucleotidyltransferase domain-containing protein n=1 Tax=Geranomyces variabilis TaxID=109894 RepID=A0AAD5XR07_9FUNG|nr:hypothetical protein HDU87_004037 [Geranomyces variabilis]
MAASIQVPVEQRPFGQTLWLPFPLGNRIPPQEVVQAYQAVLETQAGSAPSTKVPRRVFQRVFGDGETYWREILPIDKIQVEAETHLCVAERTPLSRPINSEDEGESDTGLHLRFSRSLEEIRSFLIEKENIWRVLLFGSSLNDPATANDIDIAIECRRPQNPSDIVRWGEELTTIVGKPVEVTDLAGSFHNDMLAIRNSGRYIDFGGGISDDPQIKQHQEILARCVWRMGELATQLRGFVDGASFRDNVDGHGLAKRFEGSYQQFENFAERLLYKVKALPAPTGASSNRDIIVAFKEDGSAYSDGGPTVPIPPMPATTWAGLDDLRCFRPILFAKLSHLTPIIVWATEAVLAVGLP